MTYPTLVASSVLEETVGASSHSIPGYGSAAAGDVVYGVFALKRHLNNLSITNSPGQVWWSQWNYSHSSVVNDNLTVVRTYDVIRAGNDMTAPLTLHTPVGFLVAGMSVLVRGAADQTSELLVQNGAELTPGTANGMSMQVYPGGAAVNSVDRMPLRSQDGGPVGQAKLVAAYARTGNNLFSTTEVDPIGSGLSDGAPYWANREQDMNWVGGRPTPDGLATTRMTVIDHAESDDGTYKFQVAMAHADIDGTYWSGHPSWSPYIFSGQVGISYWPVNGSGIAAVPTAHLGFRFRV